MTLESTTLNILWYIGCAVATVVGLSIVTRAYYRSRYRLAARPRPAKDNHTVIPAVPTQWPATLTVGILTPLSNEAAHYLVEGLSGLLALSGRTQYTLLPLPGNNTRVNLFERAQQAGNSCDVLVTFGLTCANIATEAASHLKNIPIIKAGLRNDQLLRLLPHSSETIVVTTEYDYRQQIALFKQIKPSAKTACILYRLQHEHIREEVQELNKALLNAGFKTYLHVLAHTTHIDNQLGASAATYDSLFLMPYTVTASTIQELVTYCSAKKITLCAQEFDIVTLGAAVGFGESEKELGSHIGHLIRNVCEGKKRYPAGTIMTSYPVYRCKINKRKCQSQGLEFSPEYMTMLEHASIVNHQRTVHTAYNHDQSNNSQNQPF
ncbi:MAG: putative tryptophan/tyrosine transport system substrate-binding protein [Candidatus Dependentiae bacterium]|nr:putative tryptophan/tyrosine transport system substrate-binding protein [Candidatus Dependentiae bacterium]